ncbi:hypothetical protein JVU11DRAFT_8524 [Chiua virens]|nr:hypothetical protein JVU11DRAFT_8524 [Chiua virens]
MIPCLEIPEILLAILEGVSEDERSHPDLVSLALTCRAFSDPALSILWRTQHSLIPLVLCFPRDVIIDLDDEDGGLMVLKFAKSPSAQDWERPLFYAKYIRILREIQSPIQMLNIRWNLYRLCGPSIVQALLDSCPTLPLFPNLQEFEYSSYFDHKRCNTVRIF